MAILGTRASLAGGVLLYFSTLFLGLGITEAANRRVDIRPCIVVPEAIVKDDSDTAEAYLTTLLYQGFWAAKQRILIASSTTTLKLANNRNTRGFCNVVYVGVEPSDDQLATLQAYSSWFAVRLVYFNTALTAANAAVQARMGFNEWYADPLLGIEGIQLTAEGAAEARVVNGNMLTNPSTNNVFTRPVQQTAIVSGTASTSVLAEYATVDGTTLQSALGLPSVGIMTYKDDTGLEEMHVFFSMAWFDLGSWGWMHYINEWGTKGVFMGERRFYLAGMVDDLFLGTGVFEYDGSGNEGAEQRVTGVEMEQFRDFEADLNAQYGSSIVTEFPFNGLGILEKVGSAYVLDIADADIALLPKGDNVDGTGITPQLPTGWLASAVPGMAEEFSNGDWSSDELLEWCMANSGDFHWQSHTLTHLARDNLGTSDCSIEDSGNAQIAVITGLFADDTYNWRSMTTPGITGLFNKFCLQSAADNLIMCAPGDNTFDGVQTSVSLISSVSPYHSIYTTEAVNEFEGFQIVPRFATYVYFNCVTGDCLVDENEYIRRIVCGCTELDPSLDKGTCSVCGDDIQSLGSVENVFKTEAETTSRYILAGHRDKYMFHQANVIPTDLPDGSGQSLLAYWYQQVMEELTSYIDFPVTSKKFDDLCSEFTLHEELDTSGAYVTARVDTDTGEIKKLWLRKTSGTSSGYIPLTVPSTLTAVNTGNVIVGSTESYGSDTTYYLTTDSDLVPSDATTPDASELAPIPVAASRSLQVEGEVMTVLPTLDPSIIPTVDPIPFYPAINPELDVPTGTIAPIDSNGTEGAVPDVSVSPFTLPPVEVVVDDDI